MFADHAVEATIGEWLTIVRTYSIATWPMLLITVAVFLWVPRFLSGGHHMLKNIAKTVGFTVAVAAFYVPVAGTLNRITHEAAIGNVLVSIRSVSAFSWFWDATVFLVLLGIAYAWSYYNRYTIENKRAAELAVRNERLGAELVRLELDLLRAQLEPHFLFNALNSISALIRSAKTDAATEALAGLSELLRYSIEAGTASTSTSPWTVVTLTSVNLTPSWMSAATRFLYLKTPMDFFSPPPARYRCLIDSVCTAGLAHSSGMVKA